MAQVVIASNTYTKGTKLDGNPKTFHSPRVNGLMKNRKLFYSFTSPEWESVLFSLVWLSKGEYHVTPAQLPSEG
jgi:hypothetical protein